MRKHLLFFVLLILLIQGKIVAQNITGTVIDAQQVPIPGVTVTVKGAAIGTATDVDGKFSLNVPNASTQTLVFTYLGYKTQERAVGNNTNFNIVLQEDAKMINEVVVIGYGVQKKSVTTAAISSVKAADIEKTTPTRIENVLNGQVAGVSMTQNSGAPGSDFNVRIRGVGTTGDNSPLYIVDGMAVDGGIRNLNPADIASVEVLKDAASAAVYGARGGNGVILITTKQGSGKARINYEMNLGWQNVWRKLPLLNSEQYMLMQNEASMNANSALPFTAQQIADAHAGLIPSTNWQDVAFNKNAPITNHQISAQGGNDKGSYYLSFGYLKQDGILGGNYGDANYDRYSVRANNDYEIFKTDSRKFLNKIKVGINAMYSREVSSGIYNNGVFGTVLSSAIGLPPTMTPYVNDEDEKAALLAAHPYALVDNGQVLSPSPDNFQEFRNPLAIYLRPDKRTYDNDKFVGTFWGELSVLPGMILRSSYAFDLAFWGENQYKFPYWQTNNMTGVNDDRVDKTQAESIMNRGFTRQIENTLTYNFNIGEHAVTLMAAQSARDMQSRRLLGRGYDLKAYDPNMAIINNAQMDVAKGGRYAEGSTDASRLASYFGRISYNYAERYMFQATIRRDGSYKFGPNNKWGNFPSFSAGWNVWNEPAFESSKPVWWDVLKIRGSWGLNGSERIVNSSNQPVPYAYLSFMESGLNYYFGGNGNEALNYGISAGRLPNPNIHWEASQQTDLGVEMYFLKSALTFTFDWYKKRTKDMLRESAEVPGYVGQSPPYVNRGIVNNHGVELDLAYRFSPAKDLNIGIRANASYNKNVVVDYGNAAGENGWGSIGAAGLDNMIYQKNGFPNPFFYGYKTDGILQNQAEADAYNAAYGATAQPGDVRFVDVAGKDADGNKTGPDGKIDANDRVMIGKPDPDWVYGLTLTADYKGFDFMAFFQGRQGCQIFDITRRNDIPLANLPAWWMDRWTGEGTSNTYPRFMGIGVDHNQNWRISDLYIQDGSFTRLKNLQIGYTLPQNLTRKIAVDRLRLWVGGENLITWTKYRGFDPEIADVQRGLSQMGNYPVARTINCGLGITF